MKKDCPEYAEIRKDGNHLYIVNIPHHAFQKNIVLAYQIQQSCENG